MENTIKKRFFDKIIKGKNQNDCWGWLGGLAHFGYGSIKYNGKMERAHRLSWIIYNGEIPKNRLVLHKCDNPPCSNPLHLYLGTQSDNIKDVYKRNRTSQKGSMNRGAKLNEEKVSQIKKMYSDGKLQEEIAKLFGTSQQNVSHIIHGRRWNFVK